MIQRVKFLSRRPRWPFLALLVLILVVAVVLSLAPLAISTDFVRDRFERDISAWTGHKVTLGTNPRLRIWPMPRIELNDVSLTTTDTDEPQLLVFAESFNAEFNILSALLGDPDFDRFELIRPRIVIRRAEDGSLGWKSDHGEIGFALAEAVRRADAIVSGQTPAPATQAAGLRLGLITIEDAALELVDAITGLNRRFTSVSGQIEWNRLDRALQIGLNGNLNGEPVGLSARSDDPLMLLSGRDGQLSFALTAAPLSVNFEGRANLSPKPFLSGNLNASTPSFPRLLAWSEMDMIASPMTGAVEINGVVKADQRRSSLDVLTIRMDDNQGTGGLYVEPTSNGTSFVSGTLDFERLNIISFLRAFSPMIDGKNTQGDGADAELRNRLAFDLRLSARTASLGTVTLNEAAAAVRVDQGRLAFDLGDADLFGGRIFGRFEIAESAEARQSSLALSARDMEFGQAFKAFGLIGAWPSGVGSLDMSLTASDMLSAPLLTSDLAGTVSARVENGMIPSFDLAAFSALAASERFFDLERVSSGSTSFLSASFTASLREGRADVSHGEIRTETALLEVRGLVPYARASVALAGRLTALDAGNGVPVQERPATGTVPADPSSPEGSTPVSPQPAERPAVSRFFIGGSWPNLIISPILADF